MRPAICRPPAVEASLPLRSSFCSLSAGTPDVSMPSQASVSRNFGPARLKSPVAWTAPAAGAAGGLAGLAGAAAGAAGAAALACSTMSPGSTALSCGTVITPLWISSATARSRIVPLR